MSFGEEVNKISSITIINPESGEVLENHDLVIKNGRIGSINPSKSSSMEKSIEGNNLFAIPGLIDSHVHALNFLNEEVPNLFDLKWVLRQQYRNLSAYIKSGVTTIRDMGSVLKLIRKRSQKAARFEIESPKILYAGPLFTVPRGYPYFIEKIPKLIEWIAGILRIDLKGINSENQARKMVDKVAKMGASCIKIAYQSVKYDDKQTEIPIIPISLIRVIVDQAHKHKLPAAVHCCYRKDFQELLDAPDIPYDSQEHLVIDEPLSNDEIKRFAERNIPISTTLMTYGVIDHVDKLESLINNEPERFEKKPLEFLKKSCNRLRSGEEVSFFIGRKCIDTGSKFMRENLKKLRDAGVTIVCATDSAGAITPAGCIYWEFLDMVRAGMTPLEALKTATCIAADVIGLSGLGRLKEGAIADIVLCEKNPLDDIENISKVAAVIRDGHLVYNK
jgi:imidazolonepropionase-like amidohydrolase